MERTTFVYGTVVGAIRHSERAGEASMSFAIRTNAHKPLMLPVRITGDLATHLKTQGVHQGSTLFLHGTLTGTTRTLTVNATRAALDTFESEPHD